MKTIVFGTDLKLVRKVEKKTPAIPIVNYKCIVWDPDNKASSSRYEKSMDKI